MKPFITRRLVVTLCFKKTFSFRVSALIFKHIKVSLLLFDCPLLNCILQVFIIILLFSLYNQLEVTSKTTIGQAPIKASLITKGDTNNIWSMMSDFRFCQSLTVVNVNSPRKILQIFYHVH